MYRACGARGFGPAAARTSVRLPPGSDPAAARIPARLPRVRGAGYDRRRPQALAARIPVQ
jgi:hypothetical protein